MQVFNEYLGYSFTNLNKVKEDDLRSIEWENVILVGNDFLCSIDNSYYMFNEFRKILTPLKK